MICPVCGDGFHRERPGQEDCAACLDWLTVATFSGAVGRVFWLQAKRFLHKASDKREALRAPAFGRRFDPHETVKVQHLNAVAAS